MREARTKDWDAAHAGSNSTGVMTRARCVGLGTFLNRSGRQHGGNARLGLFSATLLLEAIKALVPEVATRRLQGRAPRKLSCSCHSQGVLARASAAQRYLRRTGWCGRFFKALCGTREAFGLQRGTTSPCAFWHKDRGIRLVVHGGDFTSSDTELRAT